MGAPLRKPFFSRNYCGTKQREGRAIDIRLSVFSRLRRIPRATAWPPTGAAASAAANGNCRPAPIFDIVPPMRKARLDPF